MFRNDFCPRLLRLGLLVSLASFGLSGCGGGGGGGGGDDFIGAALVDVRLSPDTIDTGDRTQVRTSISEVHENGIALKFKYPSGLKFVPGTAFLTVDGEETEVAPTDNLSDDTASFLVFFLSQEAFGENGIGELSMQLEATGEVMEGLLEVDPDVNDLTVDNDDEFDSENPEFLAEAATEIVVVD